MTAEIKFFIKTLTRGNEDLCYLRNKIITTKSVQQNARMRYRTLIDSLRSRVSQEIDRFTFELHKIKELSKHKKEFTVNIDAFNITYMQLIEQISELKQLDPSNN